MVSTGETAASYRLIHPAMVNWNEFLYNI